MSSLPPRQVCIAGALFLAWGVGAVVHMGASLITGPFTIDVGCIGTGIGYGILTGRAASRKWALLVARLGLALAALVGASAAYDHFTGSARAPFPDRACMAFEWMLFAGACVYVLSALRRGGLQEWFEAEQEARPAAQSLAWTVGAVAAVFFSSQHATEWRMHETYDKAYPLCVRVVPCNAETGAGLTHLSATHNALTGMMGFEPNLPGVTWKILFKPEGQELEFSGVAAEPFEMKLGSHGFLERTLTLTRESKGVIRFPMQPLVPGKPDGKARAEALAPALAPALAEQQSPN